MSDHGPVQNNASRKRSRTSESSTGPFSGQKRDKYTMTACNECRRRKIKCTGEASCRRCENYDLHCEYSQNSSETAPQNNSRMRITSLEQNLASLTATVDQLSADLKQMRQEGQKSQESRELIKGKVKSVYKIRLIPGDHLQHQLKLIHDSSDLQVLPIISNVANNTLQMMGIQRDEVEGLSRVESATPSRCATPEPTVSFDVPNKDPLFAIGLQEIYRAFELYREEVHPVYPFVHLNELARLVPSIYECLSHLQSSSYDSNATRECHAIESQDVQVLKLVVACALVVEGRGQSRIGQILVNSVDSMLINSVREVQVDLQRLRAITLTSIYYFHADEPVLAWRTIGFAARIALEIGLHRKESLEQNVSDPQEREWAMKLFWCIYVLDRRWSFGIGMPFALQDSDIDPGLPHLHDSEPYLECLIAYGQICSRVWTAVAGYSNKLPDKETVAYLDFQIQKWQQSIPTKFQLIHPRMGEAARHQPRSLQRLRVLLYVRANQMRGYIHRHNVLSASNISENLDGARHVTDIAKDTIRVLEHLRETSTIYDTQQSAFNYFLVSALSAIFLAVCHAPAEFSNNCRNEFYIALGILNDLSAHSYISRRLWKSVKSLRNIAPKLGLSPIKPATTNQINKEDVPDLQHATIGSDNDVLQSSFQVSSSSARHKPNRTSEAQNEYDIPLSPSFVAPQTGVLSVSDNSSEEIPNMHVIGDELTNLFEVLDSFVERQQNDLSPWMTEAQMNSFQKWNRDIKAV